MKLELLLICCVLSGCSTIQSQSAAVDLPIQHAALAKHFEETANEMQSKIEEHKHLLKNTIHRAMSTENTSMI